METARPEYLLVTSDECGMTAADFAYRKLTRWPAFADWMAQHYALVAGHRPTRTEAWQGATAILLGGTGVPVAIES
jgi:hypothetical protein